MKDERVQIAEELANLINKMENKGIDPDYTGYLLFVLTGNIILKHVGLATFSKYVTEIVKKNKKITLR